MTIGSMICDLNEKYHSKYRRERGKYLNPPGPRAQRRADGLRAFLFRERRGSRIKRIKN